MNLRLPGARGAAGLGEHLPRDHLDDLGAGLRGGGKRRESSRARTERRFEGTSQTAWKQAEA